jgi:hypothetical protein
MRRSTISARGKATSTARSAATVSASIFRPTSAASSR